MSARSLLIALALIFFFGASADAHAADGLRSHDPQAYAAWAAAQYPSSPCAGREQLVVTDHLISVNALGEAIPAQCTAWVLPASDPVQLCDTVLHEFGHLAGLAHDDSHPSVMNSVASDYDDPRCVALTKPSQRQLAVETAQYHGLAHAACVKTRTRRWRCRDGSRIGYAAPAPAFWSWTSRGRG